MGRLLSLILLVFSLAGCGDPVPPDGSARIMVMGDSLLAVHGNTGQSVADALEKRLKEPVIDRSVIGARFLYPLPISGAVGLSIRQQLRKESWDWVVMNGGGNDLLFGCACAICDGQLNRLISEDGTTGAIPETVAQARNSGARVIFVGYLRSPGMWSPVQSCGPLGDRMEARLRKMAARDRGVTFLPMSDLVPAGDRSFHDEDMIHPSPKGSAAIAVRVARAMGR